MKICSINRLPKFNKLPELLFYKRKLDYVDCISVISTKTQKVEGIMECLPNKEIYSFVQLFDGTLIISDDNLIKIWG